MEKIDYVLIYPAKVIKVEQKIPFVYRKGEILEDELFAFPLGPWEWSTF